MIQKNHVLTTDIAQKNDNRDERGRFVKAG